VNYCKEKPSYSWASAVMMTDIFNQPNLLWDEYLYRSIIWWCWAHQVGMKVPLTAFVG